MSKPVFLLLGGNKLNRGALSKYQKQGYDVYVIDWNRCPPMTGDRHYCIDVKDSQSIINALKDDGSWARVRFGYTSIDLAVPSLAEIHRQLGLHVISAQGLGNCSSKGRMTSCWQNKGLLNRYSKQFDSFDREIADLVREFSLIIKPDNSSSSRGITLLDKNSPAPLVQAAFDKAQLEATNHLVVVEEFVDGQEYTVDMLGDSFGNVSVYGISRKAHTVNTIQNKIAVKLHYNCESDELQQKIADYGIRCYKALGFCSSFGHLEIILKPDGTLSPVEIGARSSGCIASDLVDIVSGRSYLGDLEAVYHGGRVPNGLCPQTEMSSVFFFYDLPADRTIAHECCILDFLSPEIRSRFFDRSQLKVGFQVPLITSDNGRIGYEILEGPKRLLTPSYLRDAETQMIHKMIQ